LLALRKARVVGARRLVILTDSELVAVHIGKTYKAKKPDMMKYLQTVRSMEKFFLGITVKSFPRHYNKEVDAIAKATALLEPLPPDVFYEATTVRSAADEATPPKFVNAIHSEDWRAPIVAAIKGYYEAEDGVIDKSVAIRARNYHIINGNLYRKGVCAPLLKCISVTEGKQLLHEIHSGMCSHHIGTRALVQKVFCQGFYWPSAVADAHDIVRQCLECQRHAPYSKFASNEIQLKPPVWPFARWGIDIVDPLPTALGNYTHAEVVVEYFSKWVEAKPLLSITSATIQKFFWQNIVCHLSVPYEVTMDNGKQFDSTDFKELCTYLGTKLCFASVYHPQPNGAVERANGVIFADIKKNITELPKIKWAEELSRVIWSHNTTTSRTTQFSPFKLLYGEEAMLPEELCLGTWRDTPSSDEALKASVQDIEEARLQARTNLLSYQEETRRWKNKKIRPKLIRSGDLVLRKIPKGKLKGKMHCKWEGPFIATATSIEAAFKLHWLSGEEEPYTWNVDMLQKYFV
jgi:hypothetical protein